MSGPSPTSRSLRLARDGYGWTAQVVERWNPHAGIRQDLFGGIDILAMTDGGLVGIQACAGSGVASHLDKLAGEPRMAEWLGTGARLEVWGWRKTKVKRGGVAVRWSVRRVAARLEAGEVRWEEAT